jgi:hypothetical protein
VDFGDPVFELGALDVFLNLAIPQGTFKGDELPLLEGLGELGEIAPGKDTVPLGAGFVVAFVVFWVCVAGCSVFLISMNLFPNSLRDHLKFGSLYRGLPDPKLLDSETDGFQPDLRFNSRYGESDR